MIAEQNAAYEKSLEVDREKRKRKEQQKLQEEEERQEREVTHTQDSLSLTLCILSLVPQAVRQSMESVLPEEPPTDCTEKLATLRVRLPNGSTVQRRFLASHTLQVCGHTNQTTHCVCSPSLPPSLPLSLSLSAGPVQLYRVHGLLCR